MCHFSSLAVENYHNHSTCNFFCKKGIFFKSTLIFVKGAQNELKIEVKISMTIIMTRQIYVYTTIYTNS